MFAPFGSSDEDRTAQWHPEPQFRGTFQILSSCLVTIGLCVWTAVHLNVPEPDHKKKVWPWRQFWRKTGWLILGVFAPELVAWTAYEQYRTACRIDVLMLESLGQYRPPSRFTRLWHKVFKRSEDSPNSEQAASDIALEEGTRQSDTLIQQEADKISLGGQEGNIGASDDPPEPKRRVTEERPLSRQNRHPWTMTHSFYTAMGGYAMDDSDSIRKFMQENHSQIVLVEKDFQQLVRLDITSLLPNLSESQIRDKSKASGLAKTLVCIQAAWFCVQCVFRLSQN